MSHLFETNLKIIVNSYMRGEFSMDALRKKLCSKKGFGDKGGRITPMFENWF